MMHTPQVPDRPQLRSGSDRSTSVRPSAFVLLALMAAAILSSLGVASLAEVAGRFLTLAVLMGAIAATAFAWRTAGRAKPPAASREALLHRSRTTMPRLLSPDRASARSRSRASLDPRTRAWTALAGVGIVATSAALATTVLDGLLLIVGLSFAMWCLATWLDLLTDSVRTARAAQRTQQR
ncbi:MAG: hypothetical protein WD336_08355 [Trueperaceae bacterium]